MRHFTEELEDLRKELLTMAGLVERAVHQSVLSLTERDPDSAQQVLVGQARINQLEIRIDELATRLLALHQPMASDLRFLTAAIKINNDLERMGDLAVNIVERSLSLISQPPVKPMIDIPRMAQLAESMVRNSLDSFVKRDAELARGVLVSDDAVDDLRDAITNELVGFMERDPSTVSRALDLILVARNLERIADHATNIAEDVLFLIQGVDVRHHAEGATNVIAASPVFRKLLLTSLALILVAVVALDFLLTRYTADRETRRAEGQLQAQARILAGEVAGLSGERLTSWTKEASVRTEGRVTLIAPGGSVLADSEHDPGTMENHAGRPEVRDALQGRTGSSVRHSSTLGRDLVYVATPVTFQGREGHALRLAVPLEQVDAAIAEVRWRILQVSLIAALLSLVIAYVTSRSLSRRIRRVQSFASGLVDARFSETLPPGPDDELGALARSLNSMSTQFREMLERLKLESARREAILAGMVEGVLAVDRELNVTFCNQAFAQAVGAGYPAPERLPVLELVRDPAFLNLLTRSMVTDEPQRQRMQLSAAEGRSFEVQAAPLGLRSGIGAIAILHDVTELERLERVRRDFVANVSHELRTPLAAIQGYAETLLDGAMEDTEHNRRFVETIKAQAVRLNNIASDLLTLSQLESTEPGPSSERISVRQAIGAAMRSVESEAQLRNIQVHSEGLPDEYVAGQRLRLEQALVNLLDNAVKFNRPGGEVWIEAGRTSDGKVRISVRDNGIGIPSDDLPRIFERFYRVDKAHSREVGGTGLGLSIVKHAIEAMGGSVAVESELGKGSKFTVVLPS